MWYQSRGDIPAKRHVQVRRGPNSALITEEVVGYEGFSGNQSILYHINSPCRLREVGPFQRLDHAEWMPEAHVHRLLDTNRVARGGDPLTARRTLLFNDDVEISLCTPSEDFEGFYRNGEGDEVIYVHRGGGTLHTVYGSVPFRERDYIVIPRGTTHRYELTAGVEQSWLCFHTPGAVETPKSYRNEYGQLLEHAPFSPRDFKPPTEPVTIDESGDYLLRVRVRGGIQEYVLDRHPFDVIGWDGYVWPYTFNADDFEPRTGRLHLPPPVHQTFQGQNFVVCTFAPRPLDWDEQAMPLPYHHSNIQSEEVMFYAEGEYAARKGVSIGCITLHPSGLPHGPQPGTAEKAIGTTHTNELGIMCDTFRPLRLAAVCQDIEDDAYAYSWNPDLNLRAGASASADR